MCRVSRRTFALVFGILLCLSHDVLWAESGILVIHVMDAQRHPISGLRIGVLGDGGSAITGPDGKARITLARDTKANSWVSLQILMSPPGSDFAMVSPWNYRATVPSFENESENFVDVVVVRQGDRAALENGAVVAALAKQINEAASKTAQRGASEGDTKANLAAIAKVYGLGPDELDAAIRKWGAKATDPYDVGVAALYERKYSQASANLNESLEHREQELASDRKAAADAAFFLGFSLSREGKYSESIKAYRRCLQQRPDDTTAMSNLGFILISIGDTAGADAMFRQALAIDESVLGPDSPLAANDLNNLGMVFLYEGQYDAAEPLFERSLAIWEKQGPGSIGGVAIASNNLAQMLEKKGDHAGAERLWRRALSISENLAPDSPEVVAMLSGLASLQGQKGDYAGAEALFRRAFAIRDKVPKPDHPAFMGLMNDYAVLLMDKGNYPEAEEFFCRALAMSERLFGPNNPSAQRIRGHLEDLSRKRSRKTKN